jgi:chemotaxis protein MotA
MDLATIAGLIVGFLILLISLLIGGVPLGTIIQPEAILIVFGGTFTSLLVHFSMAEIHNAVFSFSKALRHAEFMPCDIVEYITDAAIYVRAKGILAVQPLLDQVDIPFLQKGLRMLVDNQPADHIQAQLTTELEVQYRHDLQCAKVFEAAAGFTPTMGIIGAVIGLIKIMGMFNTPEQMGHGVASAFIATLYGVGAANLFLLPMAGKLKQRAKDEWFLKSMILQGVIAMRNEEHPTLIREKLEAYLEDTVDDSATSTVTSDYLPQMG